MLEKNFDTLCKQLDKPYNEEIEKVKQAFFSLRETLLDLQSEQKINNNNKCHSGSTGPPLFVYYTQAL